MDNLEIVVASRYCLYGKREFIVESEAEGSVESKAEGSVESKAEGSVESKVVAPFHC